MKQERVRIVDIAEELGLSTATVSNVIHGKTKKISAETVRRVQDLLEKRQYIPSMAGILLAQNSSKIVGVVINDHEKYEGHAIEDPFLAASLNALAKELEQTDHFLMLKVTGHWEKIPQFASMWNMEGMILIGFCEQDYKRLREQMHIPFVIYDGYGLAGEKFANLSIDNFDGGVQVGRFLKAQGHESVLCISDNCTCMDLERIEGVKSVLPQADVLVVPMESGERQTFYRRHFEQICSHTAVFAVSDYYAIDFIMFCKSVGLSVPEEISVVGFDDNRESEKFVPPLTTVRQDNELRARTAVELLNKMVLGEQAERTQVLPVTLVKRDSVRKIV